MLREMCLLVSGSILVTAMAAGSSAGKTSRKREIERGSYLVNAVAGCGDCHTPFAANGAPDKAHWLQGATLSFGPLQPIPNWAKQSPAIAGLPSWNPEAVVKLLERGALPDGRRPNPPMPSYHMTARDAQAVVAYLKSLAAKH